MAENKTYSPSGSSKQIIDKGSESTYNVRMNAIQTTLTTSGNSVAVRLPKELLKMSGLGKNVTLEAKEGQIIISKSTVARSTWGSKIQALIAEHGDPAQDFTDINVALADDATNLPWDGPTYEEWQKTNQKLS